MRVLVTGGAGFIGSHVADALLRLGFRVRVLDSLEPPVHPRRQKPKYLDDRIEFIEGDVRHAETLLAAIRGCDAVYHLAVERGLFSVADTYRVTRSKAKKRWEKYAAARQDAESLDSRLFGWVGPRKPHELGGSAPGSLGQGIGDMHGDRSPGGGFSETG